MKPSHFGFVPFFVLMVFSCPSVTQSDGHRALAYSPRSPEEALQWQNEVRERLFVILLVDDLWEQKSTIPLNPTTLSEEKVSGFTRQEIEIQSTPRRRIPVVVTLPDTGTPPYPGVVCIHGHGGTRYSPYDTASIYKGFAAELARRGMVTIAADVGQHEVREMGRTLMGERLWDLVRCVDYLTGMEGVDAKRIGCAGLSLGGEMAMWLGAMDTRVAATVSSGFLTTMDQMEQNHCLCWKVAGLRALVDYADIYSLIAPRFLQCQNGLKEGPKDFYVPLAREALKEIQPIYASLGHPERVSLDIHEGGHEIDLPALLHFFEENL
ncbi:MAG TPA: dienelactone hydrolase family protein [bacterium]|nr:dienelactone hydrolase family protein [bacterium]